MKDGKWILNDMFQKSAISLEEDTSSKRREQAKELYDYAVKNKFNGKMQKTEVDGEILYQVTVEPKAEWENGQKPEAPVKQDPQRRTWNIRRQEMKHSGNFSWK